MRAGERIDVRYSSTPIDCTGPDATVTNTDVVDVFGELYDTLTVDLSGGPLTPGFSAEPGGVPEVEIETGRAATSSRASLPPTDARGYAGTGAAFPGELDVWLDDGNDTAYAGAAAGTLRGEAGDDTLRGGSRQMLLYGNDDDPRRRDGEELPVSRSWGRHRLGGLR